MAITGIEPIIIGIIIVVLIFWGPKKIPEVARAIGEAKRALKEGEKDEKEIV